ncbi:MAG TPA: 50S ribosomal protein L4 [Candidatus Saccharibacteria bacterium]|nr:large subunit ribosomal protein [Patescibacteria group bacterium]HMS31054.1 50S ribosomal protein L4 [Candidatus Saccharibacteria bacterium]
MADTVKTTPAKKTVALPKEVFAVEVNNHELVKKAYEAYLANGRENYAVTKTRGLVRGGGKKPWRQKGTGRARFGSSRNPIWRGGGVVFGPTGNENYTKTIPVNQKRQALRQALTLASQSNKIIVDDFASKDGKVKDMIALLGKHKLARRTLVVVENKDEMIERASRNVSNVKVVQATYLNVYDVMNADAIVISSKAVDAVKAWLAPAQAKGGVNA